MRAFITGATGFIGSHVATKLAQSGHELHCLVRSTSDVERLRELGATLCVGDLNDRASQLEAMMGCHWVVNLAGIYSYWEPNKRAYADVNVLGTRNVMECALEAGASKVLHVSTASVYGTPRDDPFSEVSPVGPVRFSEYARTKYEGELAAWELYERRGLPLVVIYPGAVLGPGDDKPTGQYIVALLRRRLPAISLEGAVLTYVHVRDVAEAIVQALEKQDNVGERYLVGKHQLSLGDFSRMVSEISGVPLPKVRLPDFLLAVNALLLTGLASMVKVPPIWGMSLDKVRTTRAGYRFDGSKAERELGITYTPIRTALEEAIASY